MISIFCQPGSSRNADFFQYPTKPEIQICGETRGFKKLKMHSNYFIMVYLVPISVFITVKQCEQILCYSTLSQVGRGC